MTRRNVSLSALGAALALLGSIPAAGQDPQPREPQQVTVFGAADRGWLGISMNWAPSGEGPVTIEAVVPRSPAERAGIARGDTLVRVGGEAATVAVARRLRPAAGDTVRLRLRRAGRERDVRVVAERRRDDVIVFRRGDDVRVIDPDSIRAGMQIRLDTVGAHLDSLFVRLDSLRVGTEARRAFRTFTVEVDSLMERARYETIPFGIELGSRAMAGAEFTQLNAGLGRYFQTERGLLALRVAPGTPAARAGLEAGDVVVKVDGAEVETLRDLRQAVARARESAAKLEVVRQGRRRELTLRWDRGAGGEVRLYGVPRGTGALRRPVT
ncbi:MAG TPA: PDZ domain-containing protein [Longimicrobiaceae bacterium]|nr:PDZ domain-containing protein [Longimicrobiaceae bacterium]